MNANWAIFIRQLRTEFDLIWSPIQTDSSLHPAMVRFSPKAPWGMSGIRQFAAPYRVVVGAVGQHRFIHAAVIFQVGLAIAVEIVRADKHPPLYRHLEEPGGPGFVVRIDGAVETIVPGFPDLYGS